MTAALFLFSGLLLNMPPSAPDEKPSYPLFSYQTARTHEIKPQRHTIPLKGVTSGFNQLHLTLTVSPAGDVIDAEIQDDSEIQRFWPKIEGEVRQWKFMPFESKGKPITVRAEEYLELVPPERFPKKHVAAPMLRPDSKVEIRLRRTACFGPCPDYTVTVSTDGIVFDGGRYVVAEGIHKDSVDANKVRELARRFVAADFYSMDDVYRAGVTDNPTYVLSISIDGRKKSVQDYVGQWEGMPTVVSELEDAVDELAQTQRWIKAASKQ